MATTNQQTSTIGPIIGSLIVVIVLIVAALYIWGQHLNNEEKRRAEIQNAAATDGQVIIVPIHGTSTNPTDIQNDLDATPAINDPGY